MFLEREISVGLELLLRSAYPIRKVAALPVQIPTVWEKWFWIKFSTMIEKSTAGQYGEHWTRFSFGLPSRLRVDAPYGW